MGGRLRISISSSFVPLGVVRRSGAERGGNDEEPASTRRPAGYQLAINISQRRPRPACIETVNR
jgi:hypothetical protein